MNKNPLYVLIAALLFFTASQASAGPISFEFSFHNISPGADIVGIVEGLDENGINQVATSVIVTSNSLGYGIGEYVGNPQQNIWNLTNGLITSVRFLSYGMLNTAPDVTCCFLGMGTFSITTNPVNAAVLINDPNTGVAGVASEVTFTRRDVSTVPIPAPIALIGLGLLGIGISRRR